MRTHSPRLLVLAAALVLLGAPSSAGDPPDAPRETRRLRFTYGTVVTGLTPGAPARVWVPVARNDELQTATIVSLEAPGEHHFTTERRFGNRLLFVEARADDEGRIPLRIVYEITRLAVLPGEGPPAAPGDAERFLAADQLVPVGDPQLEALLGGERPRGTPQEVARLLFDAIDAHMRYDKPAGGAWGRGDALWACENGYGNCTDFHSLFLALARDAGVAARFEMGFPLPPDAHQGAVAGYHCWAWYLDGERWAPVDISEADKHPDRRDAYFARLDADRVSFTVGRDLQLEPPAVAGPANFLVYPHVEVDGAVHTTFEKQFSFEDL